MSLIDRVLTAAAPAIMGPFDDAAEYRVSGTGDPVRLRAIDSPNAQVVGQSGLLEIRHEVLVLRADIATPARGDSLTFTDAHETFFVQQHEPDGPFWRLIVRKGGS